jgi:hypothetical protein
MAAEQHHQRLISSSNARGLFGLFWMVRLLVVLLAMMTDCTVNGFTSRATTRTTQPPAFHRGRSRSSSSSSRRVLDENLSSKTSSSSSSSASSSSSSRESTPFFSSTSTTTRLFAFHPNDNGFDLKELIKLAAPFTTKSVAAAFPGVALLLAAPLAFIGDGGGTSSIGNSAVGSAVVAAAAKAVAATTGAATATAATTTTTTAVEVEILSDISHVVLDLFTVFGSPSLVAMRLASIVGRLCLMAADYLPDHFMLPEELLFQVFMLSVAWIGLVKSTLPLALSNLAFGLQNKNGKSKTGTGVTPFIRDGKAYVELFRPTGVTWKQFKALSVYALDWVDVPEGSVITSNEKHHQEQQQQAGNQAAGNDDDKDDDDYVYWLYRGKAVVHSMGKTVHDIARCNNNKSSSSVDGKDEEDTCVSAAMALLGELNWITQQQRNKASTTTSSNSNSDTSNANNNNNNNKNSPGTGTTVTAGPGGATLLRIHKTPLLKLMEDDVELAHSIRDLMFQGLQDKLTAAQGGLLKQQANAASATSTANTTNSKSNSIMMAASTADVV